MSGMPRSGSTLLCNILIQNPNYHATETSGMIDTFLMVRNNWDNVVEHKAKPNDIAKRNVMRAIPQAYFEHINKPVVFDKSRGWLSYIECYEHIVGNKVKVLVPVRDVRNIVASFETLWRQNALIREIPQEKDAYFRWQTLEGRSDVWCDNAGVVGVAYNRIKDAVIRGLRDRLHFVDYDWLCYDPKKVMKRIYEFLGDEEFDHDFMRIEQVTKENDRVHGILGLHDIRNSVERSRTNWMEILGTVGTKYNNIARFWTDWETDPTMKESPYKKESNQNI